MDDYEKDVFFIQKKGIKYRLELFNEAYNSIPEHFLVLKDLETYYDSNKSIIGYYNADHISDDDDRLAFLELETRFDINLEPEEREKRKIIKYINDESVYEVLSYNLINRRRLLSYFDSS